MTCFISNGQLYYRFHPPPVRASDFIHLDFPGIVVQAFMGLGNIAFIDSENDLWFFGISGGLITGAPGAAKLPLTQVLPGKKFKYVSLTPGMIAAIDIDGNIWVSGKFNQNDPPPQFRQLSTGVTFIQVTVKKQSCLAIDDRNNLYGYGKHYGQDEFTFLKDNIRSVSHYVSYLICVDTDDNLWISFYSSRDPRVILRAFYQVTEGSWVKDVALFYRNMYILSNNGQVLSTSMDGIINRITDDETKDIEYETTANNIVQISRDTSLSLDLLDINGKILEVKMEQMVIADTVTYVLKLHEIEGVTADLLANQHSYLIKRRLYTTKSARNRYY